MAAASGNGSQHTGCAEEWILCLELFGDVGGDGGHVQVPAVAQVRRVDGLGHRSCRKNGSCRACGIDDEIEVLAHKTQGKLRGVVVVPDLLELSDHGGSDD